MRLRFLSRLFVSTLPIQAGLGAWFYFYPRSFIVVFGLVAFGAGAGFVIVNLSELLEAGPSRHGFPLQRLAAWTIEPLEEPKQKAGGAGEVSISADNARGELSYPTNTENV